MKKEIMCMTTAQFAKLHDINRRTLHYYDALGLFTPAHKGENGYRYYDYAQGVELEFIRMLKELHMSLDEIRNYKEQPSAELFLRIADEKLNELHEQIIRLKETEYILRKKKEELLQAEKVEDDLIYIKEMEDTYLQCAPFTFEEEDLPSVFSYVQKVFTSEQYRRGIGSYIALEQVRNKEFRYEGLFAQTDKQKNKKKLLHKKKGPYLCGCHKGTWDELPAFYEKLLLYADTHGLKLEGYAYETGLNEILFCDMDAYITQIMIAIHE